MDKKNELLLLEAKKFHRNSKNWKIYEYYKSKARNLPPDEYEDFINQLIEILNV